MQSLDTKKRFHVLAVDSSQNTIALYGNILGEIANIDFWTASSAYNGFTLLERLELHLILLGDQLPGMSYRQFVATVRSSGYRYAKIPIILAATGRINGVCGDFGAQAYIDKPIDKKQLVRLLNRFLH